MTSKSGSRDLWWILALQLLLVLPFAGQAINIDDPIFVDIGRNVLKHPWHAHDFPYIFEGRLYPDMASHSHPPFVGYWIGLLMWLFGDGPHLNITLHLGFVIFPLLFAVGMYRLARRFAVFPGLVTVMAICSPAAIVASHMLMTDYPSLGLSTLGIALYIDGVDQRKSRLLGVAGVLLALAAFASYTTLVVAVLCWIYAGLKRTSLGAAWVVPFLPFVWLAAWLTYSYFYFGRFVVGGTAQYLVHAGGLTGLGLTHKLLVFPIFLVAALALPLPILREAVRWRRGIPAAAWFLSSVLIAQAAASDYSVLKRAMIALFLAIGGWILAGLCLRISRSRLAASMTDVRQDVFFLAVWITLIAAQILLAFSSGMGRYMLPLLPPLVLLTFFKFTDASLTYLQRCAWASAAAGVVLGLSLSAADFEMARVHRDIAQQLGKMFGSVKDHVRFGAEWGLRHYMLEQGFRQFTSINDGDFGAGDFVVSPHQAIPYAVPQDIMLVPVLHESWGSRVPIRLLNREAHAGYYSSAWGLLPFSFSKVPIEEIHVEQVSYLVEKLPEIVLERAPEGQVIVPIPIPDGGVDVVVPVPSRIRIPYDNPSSMRVQFSCVLAGGAPLAQCPIRVLQGSAGNISEVMLSEGKSPGGNSVVQFDVAGSHVDSIILDVEPLQPGQTRLSIRNWVVLPPESLQ